ncbi:N-terminal phage replisome organiser (Phage_rep_org_N) [Desulfosporosinus acidiphilus SJ4]|uniref:N-terminal phage replisome organiser (Phage_rep_org_N) n=1 Tax=Desulfosporosinus acidiphilus (strain DSM 22704 / JCM 16185 / SJ4) TaxID=646529 RepID=I4DAU9_DESAJ|nr:phage replisome organizer N-terminal domain-containing protein [Desulfosporosinus acidiphilus]AFM42923.1 N-terminal phage replisome organiser (Phage_rep_org_N) [Desulfosporosinus acidiphilus SJ4]
MSKKKPTLQEVIFNLPHQLKVKRLTSEQKWLWVVILILSFESPIPGKLYIDNNLAVSEEDLAWKSSIPIENLKSHLISLQKLNMLRKDNNAWVIMESAKQDECHNNSDIKTEANLNSSQSVNSDELEIAKEMGYTTEEWIALKNPKT